MFKNYLFALLILISAGSLQAKDLSILFIGNSYTYMPGIGEPKDPALPKLVKQIAESIDPSLHVTFAFHTPGGWSLEKHFNSAVSQNLMSVHYDQVILQGASLESLDLPLWWQKNQSNFGVQSFGIYLTKILDLVFQKNSNVALYVNWGRDQKSEVLQESHPGLYFPAGTPKAGQRWCGRDKFEFQKMIDDSYALHSQGYPVVLAHVGDAWLRLQSAGLVNEDELYVPDDWSHPSPLGGFVTALVMVKEIFRLDILKNTFVPKGIDSARAKIIADFLARSP